MINPQSSQISCFSWCRFGFGGDGKPLVPRTTLQRGFRTVCTNGDSIVGDKIYPADQITDAIAEGEEAMRQYDSDVDEVLPGNASFATVAERFTAHQRQEHSKVNS